MISLKSKSELEKMRVAGRATAEILEILKQHSIPGVSTYELDRIAFKEIEKRKGHPAFLGYKGYPACLCASVNDSVVHSIPSKDIVLKSGDILGLDLAVVVDDYVGDCAYTIAIGEISEEAQKLLAANEKALNLGAEVAIENGHLFDMGNVMFKYAEENGYGMVTNLGGHGIGHDMHEFPFLPNSGEFGKGLELRKGFCFTLEPMLTIGSPKIKIDKDGWTVRTIDGSLASHFEHTYAITENGTEILTKLR